MAIIAFGTQKISAYNQQHIQALKEAIISGVTLIETSSQYLNGEAHKAVSIAFRELDNIITNQVEIVSKFSYIKDQKISEQLSLTLEQLELKVLDCFMVQNIEFYLLDALKKGLSRDDRLDGMNKIIYNIFFELEQEIKNKRIKSYGISSENFSLKHNLDQFLPYEDLVSIADIAAKEVGNKKNSFTTIELPINILEQEGLVCAAWAKKNGLRVIVRRALHGIYNNKIYRFASYDESAEYYHHLNELLELCNNDTLKVLYNLFNELDSTKHKFGWIEDFDNFLYLQVTPYISNVLKNIDKKYQDTMIKYIDMFFVEYRKMVAYECSIKTKQELNTVFQECPKTMQECAIEFLKQQPNIDYILVGMRRPSYVNQLLG
jgi:aryl-alcohol dehydrogenase-like predicted oxidoreductase